MYDAVIAVGLIAFIAGVVGVGVGVGIGTFREWVDHRQFCDCKQCGIWREGLAAKAKKKEGRPWMKS
jgi:hypothetical protein